MAVYRVIISALLTVLTVWIIFWKTISLENADFLFYLSIWINSLDSIGLSDTLRNQVSNYTAPYLIVLDVINRALPEASALTVMHATGLVLYLFLTVVLIVSVVTIGTSPSLYILIPTVALIPTSLVNSLIWGQSDAFFTAFVLLAFIASIRERWILSFVFFSVALSIKLVAIFAAPAFFVLLALRGSLARLIWFPLVLALSYVLLNSLYIISGLPIEKVLTIYFDQASTYQGLSMNAPNFWYILQTHPASLSFAAEYRSLLMIVGLGFAVFVSLGFFLFGILARGTGYTNHDQLFILAISVIIFPYLLPKMHDRYFFLADIVIWLLAVVDRRYILAALLSQVGSLMAYTAFLEFTHVFLPVSTRYMIALGSLSMGAALITLVFMGFRTGAWTRIWGTLRCPGSGSSA